MKYVLERIKSVRLKNGLRQRDLAEKLGIEQSHYSRLESGKMSLSLDDLHRIAKCLNVTLSFLTDDGSGYTSYIKYAYELEAENIEKISELTESLKWWENKNKKDYSYLMADIEGLRNTRDRLRKENQKLKFKEQGITEDRRRSLNLVRGVIRDLSNLKNELFTYQGFREKLGLQADVGIEDSAALNEFLSVFYNGVSETEKLIQQKLADIEGDNG